MNADQSLLQRWVALHWQWMSRTTLKQLVLPHSNNTLGSVEPAGRRQVSIPCHRAAMLPVACGEPAGLRMSQQEQAARVLPPQPGLRCTHQVCAHGALSQHEGAFRYQEDLDIWEAWGLFAEAVSFQHVPAAPVRVPVLLHLHPAFTLPTRPCEEQTRSVVTAGRRRQAPRFATFAVLPVAGSAGSKNKRSSFIRRARKHTSKLGGALPLVCAWTSPPQRRAGTRELRADVRRSTREALACKSLSARMFPPRCFCGCVAAAAAAGLGYTLLLLLSGLSQRFDAPRPSLHYFPPPAHTRP